MKIQSKIIPHTLNLSSVTDFFIRRGYFIFDENESKINLYRQGTSFTTSLQRMPLKLSVEIQSDKSRFTLGYGCWVLFDTGDLSIELTRIVNTVSDNIGALS